MGNSVTGKASYFSCVLLLCLVSFTPSVKAQNQKSDQKAVDVVSIETGLVQTDVAVLDKDGRFVKGLTAKQFQLQVNKQPREILFFEHVVAGSASEDARLAAARGRATVGDTGTVVSDRGRTIYFYLDDYHLSARSTQHTRDLLSQFVNQIKGEEDEITIVTATGQLGFLEQPTRENAVLQKTISNFSHKSFTATDAERTPMSEHQARSIMAGERRVTDYFVEQLLKEMTLPRPRGPSIQTRNRTQVETTVKSRARAIVDQLAAYTAGTLIGLDRLLRSSSVVPDRKVLFFISDGFLLDQEQVTGQALLQVADAAARSGTVIYAIDARGLSTGNPDAATRMSFDNTGRLVSSSLAALNAGQQPLDSLSLDSGGRAFLNTNIANDALVHALKETAEYYLVAWRPEESEARSGKFQTIELGLVNRPDLNVRGRHGFMAATEAPKPTKRDTNAKKKAPDPLSAALHSIFPQNGLPVSLALGYLDTPDKLVSLTATIEVAREAVRPPGVGESQSSELEVMGSVINEQGKGTSAFEQTLTVTSLSNPNAGQRIVYNHQLQLPPGLYQLRVAVRDKKTGRIGSASEWIAVPNFKDNAFSLSSLFLGEMNDEALSTGKLPINADHRFRSSARLGFFTYIYHAERQAGASDVALQIHILRDSQPVVTKPIIKVDTSGLTDPTRIAFGEDLSLAELPAGKYVLRVTAIDRLSMKTASQVSRFTIY